MSMQPVLRFKTNAYALKAWDKTHLSQIATVTMGQSPSSDAYNEDYDGLPLIQGNADIVDGFTKPSRYTTEVTKRCQEGDVILSVRAPVGELGIASEESCIGRGVCAIRASDKSDTAFIYQLLQAKKKHWKTLEQGSTFTAVSGEDVKAFEVAVPTKEEQQKIAAFFTALDEKLVITNKKLSSLKLRKQLLLNRTFKQELNFTDDNYATWEETKLGTIAKISSASRVHRNQWQSDGIPFFRSSDVVSAYNEKANSMGKAYISEEFYAELTKKSGSLQYGDLLITGGGSVGIPYLVKEDKLYTKDADLIWIQRPNNDAKFLPEFLYKYFETSVFKNYLKSISHSGTIAHYTIKQVKDTPIKLPSIEEQKRIVSFFSMQLMTRSISCLQRRESLQN